MVDVEGVVFGKIMRDSMGQIIGVINLSNLVHFDRLTMISCLRYR